MLVVKPECVKLKKNVKSCPDAASVEVIDNTNIKCGDISEVRFKELVQLIQLKA